MILVSYSDFLIGVISVGLALAHPNVTSSPEKLRKHGDKVTQLDICDTMVILTFAM